MDLEQYLERINWSFETAPTLDVLGAMMRAHNHTIAFENLDVQLGRPVTTDVEQAWDKLITRRRGGWCYEQNGVFGAALEMIGFDVQRVSASVQRLERGLVSHANHLTLIAGIPGEDQRWLVDVGFGGSLLAPIPMLAEQYEHVPYEVGLRRLDDGYWQFWESSGDAEFTFDFEDKPADENAMSTRCDFLQSNPESSFVQNLICQLRHPSSHVILRGRVLTTVSDEGRKEQRIDSADELADTVRNVFELDVPEVGRLWDRICERHEQLGK